MKALSLHQPWATLIARGHKRIETRSWRPPFDLKGRHIAIHAAKKVVWSLDYEWDDLMEKLLGRSWQFNMPQGAIVATARIVSADQVGTGPLQIGIKEMQLGDYGLGRYMWRLDNVRSVEPVLKARGYQGLWDLSKSLPQQEVDRLLEHATQGR